MNKVIIMGRLTKDPDYHDGETPFCRYTVAVDRQKKDDPSDFIPCVACGKKATFANDHLKKGTKILITGRIQTGKYTDRDGATHYTTDVIIENQEFCESKKPKDEDFVNIPDDAEIPFR